MNTILRLFVLSWTFVTFSIPSYADVWELTTEPTLVDRYHYFEMHLEFNEPMPLSEVMRGALKGPLYPTEFYIAPSGYCLTSDMNSDCMTAILRLTISKKLQQSTEQFDEFLEAFRLNPVHGQLPLEVAMGPRDPDIQISMYKGNRKLEDVACHGFPRASLEQYTNLNWELAEKLRQEPDSDDVMSVVRDYCRPNEVDRFLTHFQFSDRIIFYPRSNLILSAERGGSTLVKR